MILKVLIWQGYEKPIHFSSKVFCAVLWLIVVSFIGATNIIIRDELALNEIVKTILRIYITIAIPFVFPALSISTKLKNKISNVMLFRFDSIIGVLFAPFYVILNISKI